MRQRQASLYGQTAVHASFGDVELAQMTLRGGCRGNLPDTGGTGDARGECRGATGGAFRGQVGAQMALPRSFGDVELAQMALRGECRGVIRLSAAVWHAGERCT